jgi:hypothetical protein
MPCILQFCPVIWSIAILSAVLPNLWAGGQTPTEKWVLQLESILNYCCTDPVTAVMLAVEDVCLVVNCRHTSSEQFKLRQCLLLWENSRISCWGYRWIQGNLGCNGSRVFLWEYRPAGADTHAQSVSPGSNRAECMWMVANAGNIHHHHTIYMYDVCQTK